MAGSRATASRPSRRGCEPPTGSGSSSRTGRCACGRSARTSRAGTSTRPRTSRLVVWIPGRGARRERRRRLGKPVEFGYKAQARRQRRRRHRRSQRRSGQPARRPDAAAGGRTDQAPNRAPTAGRHRRSWLRRTRSGRRPPPCRGALRRVAHQGPGQRSASTDREPAGVPQDGPLAHRMRRTDQLRQTRLRTQPHPHRRHHRSPNLVRSHSPASATSPPTSAVAGSGSSRRLLGSGHRNGQCWAGSIRPAPPLCEQAGVWEQLLAEARDRTSPSEALVGTAALVAIGVHGVRPVGTADPRRRTPQGEREGEAV
jgi:hypothetical protein